jgi:hypothetical protein
MVWWLTIDDVAADAVARREHGSQCHGLSMTWKSMPWVVDNVKVDAVGYFRCRSPLGLIGITAYVLTHFRC